MSITIRIPRRKGRGKNGARGRQDAVIIVAVAVFVALVLAVFGFFTFYYVKYARIVDRRMQGPIFNNSARVYAAPPSLHVGEKIGAEEIAGELARAGYSRPGKNQSQVGTFSLVKGGIEIEPGPAAVEQKRPARIGVSGGKIVSIEAGPDQSTYELEPQLVTSLFDAERSKREMMKFRTFRR